MAAKAATQATLGTAFVNGVIPEPDASFTRRVSGILTRSFCPLNCHTSTGQDPGFSVASFEIVPSDSAARSRPDGTVLRDFGRDDVPN
mgnify:CR=1 FL=1